MNPLTNILFPLLFLISLVVAEPEYVGNPIISTGQCFLFQHPNLVPTPVATKLGLQIQAMEGKCCNIDYKNKCTTAGVYMGARVQMCSSSEICVPCKVVGQAALKVVRRCDFHVKGMTAGWEVLLREGQAPGPTGIMRIYIEKDRGEGN
jgi:hypothetical protein